MKAKFSFSFLLFAMVFVSCSPRTNYMHSVVAPGAILKSTMSFLKYREQYVRLYEDFTAMDPASNVITKKSFLKLLSTGEYLPLRMVSKDSSTYYKLYKLDASIPDEIRNTIKYWGLEEYDYYNMEGQKLPNYNFKDLKGRIYNNQNTKGKILVIKCWFIDCLPCIKEMPLLNELKQQYNSRKDIRFISLCWDSKKDVEKFLKKTIFNYAVVPDQYKFLTERLHLNAYPTHFVINKLGFITIKTNEYRALAYALKMESLK